MPDLARFLEFTKKSNKFIDHIEVDCQQALTKLKRQKTKQETNSVFAHFST